MSKYLVGSLSSDPPDPAPGAPGQKAWKGSSGSAGTKGESDNGGPSGSARKKDNESLHIKKLLVGKKVCLEVCVYRTPAKTGTVYWYSESTAQRGDDRQEEEEWAVFRTSWKPIETEIAVKDPREPLGIGIDLVIRMLPHPDLPHGYCWLPASQIGPSQRVDRSGYAVVFTVSEPAPGSRTIRVDAVAVSMSWIKTELRQEPRLARLQWFKELGLVKE
ncbi:hypothetical protein DFJ74DRAFT_700720 [Hyaloraphidium curvatum]|nr:hypothetical protein DFJ74DRAFT_700720 [Hyaloraphidium curvatum]